MAAKRLFLCNPWTKMDEIWLEASTNFILPRSFVCFYVVEFFSQLFQQKKTRLYSADTCTCTYVALWEPCNYILVKIANYPLLYWWMNSSNFRSIQLLKQWPWYRKFGKSLILASLSFSSASHIPYYINFRFNNRPNISSILACFLCQFVILEACSCLKNDNDTVNLVSHWHQLACFLVRSVIFRITSTSGLLMG